MDATIEDTIEAVSRAIDKMCDRVFYQRASTTLIYDVWEDDHVRLEDIYDTTGMTVKSDTSNDGTFDYTHDAADYFTKSASNQPGWPVTDLYLRAGSFTTGRQTLEVVANYGWSAVPDDVKEACLIMANRSLHRRNSPEGVAGFSEFGVARISRSQDSDAINYLYPYQRIIHIGI